MRGVDVSDLVSDIKNFMPLDAAAGKQPPQLAALAEQRGTALVMRDQRHILRTENGTYIVVRIGRDDGKRNALIGEAPQHLVDAVE